jgi:hypothetical protein
MNPTIRIFMLGGTYVETQTFEDLDDFAHVMQQAEAHNRMVHVKGKIGEDVAIRPAAIAYAVEYKS